MQPCSQAYMESLRQCSTTTHRSASPNCLWVSSVYARDIADVEDSLQDAYWISNLVSPVLFSQALQYALGESTFRFAIEVGPHPALKGPATQVIEEALGETMPYAGLLSRGTDDFNAIAGGLGHIWASINESMVDFQGLDSFLNSAPKPKLL
jgi:hybrid polyketide synthase / nonribosomal peptide synthetase ACE1